MLKQSVSRTESWPSRTIRLKIQYLSQQLYEWEEDSRKSSQLLLGIRKEVYSLLEAFCQVPTAHPMTNDASQVLREAPGVADSETKSYTLQASNSRRGSLSEAEATVSGSKPANKRSNPTQAGIFSMLSILANVLNAVSR